jgi:gas vesicle protein
MTKKQKIVTGIIIGAAAGVAATIFFETERGKKLLENLKQLASDSFNDALERVMSMENKFSKLMMEEAEDIEADEVLS